MTQRKLRLLLVDDEAHTRNLGRIVAWLDEKGLIEARRIGSLDDLVAEMGITYDAQRNKFGGDVMPFDYDVAFLDWRLDNASKMVSTLSAFAFIPDMRSRYIWSRVGEETEIVAYSKVWESEVCRSLEGYLLGLQLRKRLTTPEAEDLEQVLFRKGMNIVSRMVTDRVRGLVDSVRSLTDDEFAIYPSVRMTCFALFPVLAYYQMQGNDGALADWQQRVSTELQMLVMRSAPLYAYTQRARFVAITHHPVDASSAKRSYSTYTAAELDELLEAELKELQKEYFEDGLAQQCQLPATAKQFINAELQSLRSILSGAGQANNSLAVAVGRARATLKAGLRFRYANTGNGYAALADIAAVEQPDNGAKWCSYVFVPALSEFVGTLQGQLKGDGRLDRIVIDEERRVAFWHFTQNELVTDLQVIRDSAKWAGIWAFAREYGQLYACVTETDASGDLRPTWKSADGQPVDNPVAAANSTFVLALPVWRVA